MVLKSATFIILLISVNISAQLRIIDEPFDSEEMLRKRDSSYFPSAGYDHSSRNAYLSANNNKSTGRRFREFTDERFAPNFEAEEYEKRSTGQFPWINEGKIRSRSPYLWITHEDQ
ncbi:hypothetical protein Tcan_01167, partial [Toxocara canis]